MSKFANRRRFVFGAAASTAVAGFPTIIRAVSIAKPHKSQWLDNSGKLKIGLLWSLTGDLSVIERASHDVALFWVDKVNRQGGVAGLKIDPVIIDAKSDIKAYREGALHLMKQAQVLAIFGGYTSASRRAIMPLVELNEGLLFYPASYPGRECWQRIVCTGPVANQHLFDLVPFMCRKFGMRAYFVGSNNVRSQESHRYAKHLLIDIGGEVAGETYVPAGKGDFSRALSQIRSKRPDWVLSTVVGGSDILFRKAYAEAGFSPEKLPTASLTTSELEANLMGRHLAEGHFVSAPYFQSIASDCNRQFIGDFLDSPHGKSGVTHFNMEETYLSFLYFKKSVERVVAANGAMALNPKAVRDGCGGVALSSAEAPEGAVRIDRDNFNSWLTPKIGRFNAQGQVDILYQRETAVRPQPFALYPSRGRCKFNGLHLPHGQIVRSAS